MTVAMGAEVAMGRTEADFRDQEIPENPVPVGWEALRPQARMAPYFPCLSPPPSIATQPFLSVPLKGDSRDSRELAVIVEAWVRPAQEALVEVGDVVFLVIHLHRLLAERWLNRVNEVL